MGEYENTLDARQLIPKSSSKNGNENPLRKRNKKSKNPHQNGDTTFHQLRQHGQDIVGKFVRNISDTSMGQTAKAKKKESSKRSKTPKKSLNTSAPVILPWSDNEANEDSMRLLNDSSNGVGAAGETFSLRGEKKRSKLTKRSKSNMSLQNVINKRASDKLINKRASVLDTFLLYIFWFFIARMIA